MSQIGAACIFIYLHFIGIVKLKSKVINVNIDKIHTNKCYVEVTNNKHETLKYCHKYIMLKNIHLINIHLFVVDSLSN